MTILTLKRATVARIVAAGVAAAMLIGCGQQSPEKLMASAKGYLAKGDRNAAVIQLKNLLAKLPDNGEARLLLGEALLDATDFASAEKELSRALELKQPQERVVPLYVRALLGQGKNQAVVAEVEKYKLFDPAAVAATQTALGDAYRQLRNRERAYEAYATAMAAVPGHARARLGEALLVASEGRVEEALTKLDELIAAEPKLAEARAVRGEILLAKGDRPAAIAALKEAIAADSMLLPPQLVLIDVLIDQRELDAAAKLLADARKLAPQDLRVPFLAARLAFRRGDNGQAREDLQQVLKYMPDHTPSLALAGAVEISDRKFEVAEAHLRRLLSRVPNHVAARLMLVQALLQMGQPTKAKDVLQPLLDKGMPKNPRILLFAGETLLANGDIQQATAFYRAAAQGAGAYERVARTRLGQIALATGQSDEGFEELELASELGSDTYQADLSLIAGHLSRREFDKALESVRTLEKKQPKSPLTFQMYGLVYLAKGDNKEARKSFEKALGLVPSYLPAAQSLAGLDILEKRPEDARKRLDAMIARESNNEQPYLALAEVQARTGATAKDIDATLQRAVSANPRSVASRVALVNLRLRAGEPKAALAAAQDAQAVLSAEPRILAVAAAAQEAAGEVNQAVETYNKLAALQPTAVEPLYRLAALYVRQNDTDKAIETLRRAQKIAPRGRDVVPLLVEVYVAAGRNDEAFKEARVLQKLEPKHGGGYALEADVYLAQRKYAEAERLYREALKLEPKAEFVAIKLHGTLEAAGKTSEADAWGKKWIAANPGDVRMRLYLGGRDLAAKNLKAATPHYQAVIGIEPNNTEALNNLAWIGGKTNDPKALGYAERAVSLEPNNASVLDTYGMLLVKKGEVDKGLAFLQRARSLAPARNELRLNYAKALISAGKGDDARKELLALQGVKESFAGKEEVAGLLKGL